jgi:tRNA (guanine26-N2/guanine27-N2)-dimethyltransferase
LENILGPLEEAKEGRARLLIPRMELYRRPDGVYEPAWAPVFYNPRMAPNRDIAILFARVYRRMRKRENLVIAEPLVGSGVRAIRYAVEAGAWVYAGDVDPNAVRLARLNARLNNVETRVHVETADANELLASLRRRASPDIVDLDPFGSPAPFIDTAIQSIKVRGVVAATATDTAPLCGTHPRALRRRYNVRPARTAWEKEQAVRILAGYIIRRAAAHEYGARILLAYYSDYYVRVYAEITKGAKRADESLETLGYGVYCDSCGYTATHSEPPRLCPYCGGRATVVGPLYRGPLCDHGIIDEMLEEAEGLELAAPEKVISFLKSFRQECGITKPYYRIDRICSMLGVSMPRPAAVAEALREEGYRAVRTVFDPRGVKTDAPHSIVLETVRRLSPSRRH